MKTLVALLCAGVVALSPLHAQDDQEAFAARLMQRLQTLQKNASLADLGAMTGLWRTESNSASSSTDVIYSVMHINDVYIQSVVDLKTGNLSPAGFAELKNNEWRGWWSLICRDCCPGVSWWDRGALRPSLHHKPIAIHIVSKKMDPKTCQLTDTPDDITLTLKAVKALSFKEFLPGKIVSIVAAPAVGNQASQYKAAVTVKWNLANLGVSTCTVAALPGGALVNNTTKLEGEYAFTTDKSGEVKFLLAAFNKAGQPLHVEITSVDIPAIRGIGR